MKRFTETQKWTDLWFRRLPLKIKLLWLYLCDCCDNAGVWKIDLELASFHIGAEITLEDFEKLNDGKKRIRMINDELLLICDFIQFQIFPSVASISSYEKLTNLQRNCLNLIKKYKQKGIDMSFTSSLPVSMVSSTGKKKKHKTKKTVKVDKNIVGIKRIWNGFAEKLKKKGIKGMRSIRYPTKIDKTLDSIIHARLQQYEYKIVARAIYHYYKLWLIPEPTRKWTYALWGLKEFLRRGVDNVDRFYDWEAVKQSFTDIEKINKNPLLEP